MRRNHCLPSTAAVVAARTAAVVAARTAAAVAAFMVAAVAAASTVVDMAASTVARVPTAVIAAVNGKGTGVVAGTGGWAENRHRHAIPAQQGVRHHWVVLTPRQDGTRLNVPAAAAGRLQVTKWELPTVNGIPLVAPAVRLELR